MFNTHKDPGVTRPESLQISEWSDFIMQAWSTGPSRYIKHIQEKALTMNDMKLQIYLNEWMNEYYVDF